MNQLSWIEFRFGMELEMNWRMIESSAKPSCQGLNEGLFENDVGFELDEMGCSPFATLKSI